MEALEVFKGRRKIGLKESSAMVLLALGESLEAGQIASRSEVYDRSLYYALQDLRERNLISSEQGSPAKRRLKYSRTEQGEKTVKLLGA